MIDEYQSLTIDLLRHGEVDAPPAFFGSTNVPLSRKGEMQMRHNICQDKWSDMAPPWEVIITSPLQRCHSFAEKMAQNFGIQLVIEHDLKEIHFGDWEGLSAQQISLADPAGFQQFCDTPLDYTPPNGENFNDFKRRTEQAWSKLTQQYLNKKRILIVSHSGVIRTLLCKALNSPPASIFALNCPYACYSQVQHLSTQNKQNNILMTHNSHLDISTL